MQAAIGRTRKPNTFDYALASEIYGSWLKNNLIGVVLYGAWNVGKSAYSLKVLMDLWDDPQGKRLDEWKVFIPFKPEQYVSLNLYLLTRDIKAKLIIWDDAGLWLFALDWNDPKVKGAMKFLNVAKTTSGGLILTTPTPEMILKKVTKIEGIHIGKVSYGPDSKHHDTRHLNRVARIYRNNIAPWGARYIKQTMEDHFNVMLPDHVWEWYDPVRKKYAKEAIKLMADAYGVDMDFDQCNSVEQAYSQIMLAGAAQEMPKPEAEK